MQINKINNAPTSPNFQAKIIMEPQVLKYLTGKEFDRNEGKYLGLFDFQYSPLAQRKILYNILKHIKKDNIHKTIKIGGGWSGGMWKEHVYMMVDGVMGERWTCFPRYSSDSIRPEYIQKILNFAHEIYPNANFEKHAQRNIKNKDKAIKEFEHLGEKIDKLVNDDDSHKSLWAKIKDKLDL